MPNRQITSIKTVLDKILAIGEDSYRGRTMDNALNIFNDLDDADKKILLRGILVIYDSMNRSVSLSEQVNMADSNFASLGEMEALGVTVPGRAPATRPAPLRPPAAPPPRPNWDPLDLPKPKPPAPRPAPPPKPHKAAAREEDTRDETEEEEDARISAKQANDRELLLLRRWVTKAVVIVLLVALLGFVLLSFFLSGSGDSPIGWKPLELLRDIFGVIFSS